jgi:predicted nucleic acid-binding protein
MGRVTRLAPQAGQMRRMLVLDSGALIGLVRGDIRARAVLAAALARDYEVVVPTPVVAQVHRGGRDHAQTDRVLGEVDAFLPTSTQMARQAGELLARAEMSDAVDAIVAAEALVGAPSMVLTSDAHDLARLVEAGQEPDLVEVVGI